MVGGWGYPHHSPVSPSHLPLEDQLQVQGRNEELVGVPETLGSLRPSSDSEEGMKSWLFSSLNIHICDTPALSWPKLPMPHQSYHCKIGSWRRNGAYVNKSLTAKWCTRKPTETTDPTPLTLIFRISYPFSCHEKISKVSLSLGSSSLALVTNFHTLALV